MDIFYSGFSRSTWVAVHICFGMVGLAGIVLHIVWHWAWLKALRGRSLSGMPGKVRANRVVNRGMWLAYIATNVFGAVAGALHFGEDIYVVGVPDRLHVGFGVAWTILTIVHLTLHWKWIASTTRHHLLGCDRFHRASDQNSAGDGKKIQQFQHSYNEEVNGIFTLRLLVESKFR